MSIKKKVSLDLKIDDNDPDLISGCVEIELSTEKIRHYFSSITLKEADFIHLSFFIEWKNCLSTSCCCYTVFSGSVNLTQQHFFDLKWMFVCPKNKLSKEGKYTLYSNKKNQFSNSYHNNYDIPFIANFG